MKFLSKIFFFFLFTVFFAFPVFAQTPAATECKGGIDNAITIAIDQKEVDFCVENMGTDSHDQCVAIQCALERALSHPDTKQEWWNPTLGTFSKKVFDSPKEEIFGERYTYAQVNWIINSIFTLLLPRANKMSDVIDLITIIKSLAAGQIPASLQPVADIISFPFTHPVASAKDQLKITLAKLQIAPPVSAQGLGYAKLAGSANINILWTATRNMAYLISIILLIAAGFMAMFRTKINPQTVVSIQMILPKLAVSLVLITFSLAIVGFVIDMIYVSLAAIVGFLTITGISTNLGANINLLLTAQTSFISNLFLWWYVFFAIAIIILMLIIQNIALPLAGLIYMLLALLLGLFVWSIIAMVRIFITLIHAYLNLLILTITGPLQIMMDIVPADHKSGFVPWFKCVVGNASVFVITGILAIVAQIIFGFGRGSSAGPSGNFQFSPGIIGLNPGFSIPFINTGGDWLLGDITQVGTMGAGVLLGMIFLPLAFFSAMPGLMVTVRNVLCKTDDPSSEVAKMIDGIIKQLTSGQPHGLKTPPTSWRGYFTGGPYIKGVNS